MIICVRFCGRRPTAQAPPRTGAARRLAGPTGRADGPTRGATSREWRRRRAPTTWPGRRPTASAPPRTGAARRLAGRGRRLHRGSGRGWSSWREAGRRPSSWPRPSAGEAIARPPLGAARPRRALRRPRPPWRTARRSRVRDDLTHPVLLLRCGSRGRRRVPGALPSVVRRRRRLRVRGRLRGGAPPAGGSKCDVVITRRRPPSPPPTPVTTARYWRCDSSVVRSLSTISSQSPRTPRLE